MIISIFSSVQERTVKGWVMSQDIPMSRGFWIMEFASQYKNKGLSSILKASRNGPNNDPPKMTKFKFEIHLTFSKICRW